VEQNNWKKVLIRLGSFGLVLIMLTTAFLTACSQPAPSTAPPPVSKTIPPTTQAPATNPNSSTTSAPPPTSAPVAKPITLVFNTFKPNTDYQSVEIFQPWFAEIEKRTGGRVKVEAHYNQELVKLPDTYNAIKSGTIDMGHFIPTDIPGKFLMDNALLLPRYDNLGWKPSRTYYDLYQQFPQMQAQYNEVKPVYFFSLFAAFIGTAKKPIRKLEDNQGLKMICSGTWGPQRGKALGWTPVSSSPAESFMMWQTGVADGGGTLTLADISARKLGEVLHYATLVPVGRAPQAIAINLDKWNSLPPDAQKIITDMMGEMSDNADKVELAKYQDALVQAPKQYTIEFITLPPDELARWVKVDQPVVDSYIAQLDASGRPGKQFYDAYQALEKKYSASEYAPK
jgi:TRAP-type transport system periplasmic protein